MIKNVKNVIGIFFGFGVGICLILAGKFMDDQTAKIFFDSFMKELNKYNE